MSKITLHGLQAEAAAAQDGRLIPDVKPQALRRLTQAIANDRGRSNAAVAAVLFEAGYSRANVLKVILAACIRMLSNYTNRIADMSPDRFFEAVKWRKPAKRADVRWSKT